MGEKRREAIEATILTAIKETHFVNWDPDSSRSNTAYWLSGRIESVLQAEELAERRAGDVGVSD